MVQVHPRLAMDGAALSGRSHPSKGYNKIFEGARKNGEETAVFLKKGWSKKLLRGVGTGRDTIARESVGGVRGGFFSRRERRNRAKVSGLPGHFLHKHDTLPSEKRASHLCSAKIFRRTIRRGKLGILFSEEGQG